LSWKEAEERRYAKLIFIFFYFTNIKKIVCYERDRVCV